MKPPEPEFMFDGFALDARLVDAVRSLGFEKPTSIQAETIPALLEGRDVIGRARTGSGKTAAFGLPMLHRLREGGSDVRALVLAPTRELALQVTEALRGFAKNLELRIVTIYGGASYVPQLKALKRGVPIVVGTPGRVLDHLDRGSLSLANLELLVLDEADEMLRMGFFDDVQRVLEASPDGRQVVLFSATMPEQIKKIATRRMTDPLVIQVEDRALSVDHIDQRWLRVPTRFKPDALVRLLAAEAGTALVFTRTRAGCAEVADGLARRGVSVDALHGDLNQAARERVLTRLRAGKLAVVVATDVAARGIDVDHIRLVVNYDLPTDPEQYVHRIGRTARAGKSGRAISFVIPREVPRIGRLSRVVGVRIEPMDVPSDADIRNVRVSGLADELSLTKLTPLSGLLERLGSDLTDRELAHAAIALLARERGIDPSAEADDAPPKWAQRPTSRASRDRSGPSEPWERNAVTLFMPVGKRRGVRPSDIVGAIANEVGVNSKRIGRITVLDAKTFVELSREVAEMILEDHPQLEIRGRRVPVTLARPRGTPGSGAKGPSKKPAFNKRARGKKKRSGPKPPKKRWNRNK